MQSTPLPCTVVAEASTNKDPLTYVTHCTSGRRSLADIRGEVFLAHTEQWLHGKWNGSNIATWPTNHPALFRKQALSAGFRNRFNIPTAVGSYFPHVHNLMPDLAVKRLIIMSNFTSTNCNINTSFVPGFNLVLLTDDVYWRLQVWFFRIEKKRHSFQAD